MRTRTFPAGVIGAKEDVDSLVYVPRCPLRLTSVCLCLCVVCVAGTYVCNVSVWHLQYRWCQCVCRICAPVCVYACMCVCVCVCVHVVCVWCVYICVHVACTCVVCECDVCCIGCANVHDMGFPSVCCEYHWLIKEVLWAYSKAIGEQR